MSSGYTAIGAAVLNEELSNALRKYEDASATFAWTPLACCITKANIELILKEDLPANAASQGNYLLEEVRALFHQHLPVQTGEVRGLGLMIGIDLVQSISFKVPAKKLIQRFIITALRKNLMVCSSWDLQTLIFMPPLNITRGEINEGLNKIESTLQSLAE